MNLFKFCCHYVSLLVFVLSGTIASGQIIKHVIIPVSGLGEGPYQLGWYRNANESEINFYLYGEVKAQLWAIGKQSFADLMNKHREKSKLGKLMNSFNINNFGYAPHTFTTVREIRLDDNLKVKQDVNHLFHSSPFYADTILHIGKFSGNIASLNSRGVDGLKDGEQFLKFNLRTYNNLFPDLPHIGDTLSTEVGIESENWLGNPKAPHYLVRTIKRYQHDGVEPVIYGFTIHPTKEKVSLLNQIERLNGCTYIAESFNKGNGQYMPFWFLVNQTDKKDQRNYRLAVANARGNVVGITDFTTLFSRRPIILNKEVYGRNGQPVGFVSVFGYDHKAPKEIQGSESTAFDVIYLDQAGSLKWKTTIYHGDDKSYKNAIFPLQCYAKDDKLVFLNYRREGLLKTFFEVLSIDERGNKELVIGESKGKVFGNDSPLDFVYQADEIRQHGEDIWTIKAKSEGVYPQPTTYSQLFVAQLDGESFHPKNRKVFTIQTSRHKLRFTLLDDQGAELKYLVGAGAQYYILTLRKEKESTLVQLKSDLFNNAADQVRFSFSQVNVPLIDQESRVAYLIHQFYENQDVRFDGPSKLLITKVAY